MAEYSFGYEEIARALYRCGYSFEKTVELIKDFDANTEFFYDCIEKYWGPFSEGTRITLDPDYLNHGILVVL